MHQTTPPRGQLVLLLGFLCRHIFHATCRVNLVREGARLKEYPLNQALHLLIKERANVLTVEEAEDEREAGGQIAGQWGRLCAQAMQTPGASIAAGKVQTGGILLLPM